MGALTHNGEIMQGLPANASQINFDKTGTDLNATQAEAAIKEVNRKVNTNTEDINQLKSGLTQCQNITSSVIVNTSVVTQNDSGFITALDGKMLLANLDFTVNADLTTGTNIFTNLGFPKQQYTNYWIPVTNIESHETYFLLLYSNRIAVYQGTLPAGRYKGCLVVM